MPASLFNLGRYINKPKTPPAGDSPVVDTTVTTTTSSQSQYSAASTNDGDIAPSPTLPPPPHANDQPLASSNEPSQPGTSGNDEKKETVTSTPPVPGEDKLQKRAGMDILSRLTQRSNKALVAAVTRAKQQQIQFVDTEYILWGLLQDSGIYQLLSDFKVTPTEVVKAIESKFTKGSFKESPKFSPRVKKVLELSFPEARSHGYEFISPEHVLVGLLKEGEGLAAQILSQFGLTAEKLQQKVSGKKEVEEKEQKSASSEFTTDMTQQAREGKLDPVIARSKEIERVMHILSRRTKNNPVLIGDAGVGKTAIVEGLAQRIVSGNVPESLLNKRILSLDLTGLLAGASHRGEFEKRFKSLIDEVKGSQGQIILFIDELHTLVGAGNDGGGAMDASNILKPSLARGEIQTIGTTTVTEYRKYIEKDRALERRFQPVLVPEPTPEEAIEMLAALKDKYEAFHKVAIPDEVIRSAVRLSARYVGDRFLPDKAIDLIDEAASSVKLPAISLPEEIRTLEDRMKRSQAEQEEAHKDGNAVREGVLERDIKKLTEELEVKKKDYEVKKGATTTSLSTEVIQEVVSRWTGIPISRLTESESDKLVRLEDVLHQKIIDQEEAVSAVSEAVRRGRSGLSSQKRPIGSFIFMGPTGVGKTELAKVLASELFGSEDMMIRLDMTEYMEKHEVAKLIGAPPGYVGYEEGGQLTEAVRRKPYSVVLMDEIEKAHPDVFNILLQILDDGRLTDNKGRTISFKNTILICTSNLGTNLIQKTLMSEMKVGQPILSKKDTLLATLTVTPTGRMIATRGEEYWEQESVNAQTQQTSAWANHPLLDYFKGQKLLDADALVTQQKFPTDVFDTHVVLPSGEEMITRGDRLWRRKSTIAKEWESMTLLDYVKDSVVSNASADKPDEQLPTASWNTHAISPQEKEIIGVGTRLWVRDNLLEKNWKTMSLAEYVAQTTTPPVAEMTDVKQTIDVANAGGGATAATQDMLVPDDSKSPTIHLFLPTGVEHLIFGNETYMRNGTEAWKKQQLSDVLVGENTPVVAENASEQKEDAGADSKFTALTDLLLEELRKFFRPELLNRFDEVIVFRPLTAEHMLAILGLQLKALHKNLEEQNLGLDVTDRAKEELTIVGFDPVYGARPLRRTIQRLIENPISTMMIQGSVKDGDTIAIDYDSQTNDFVFNVKRVAPATDATVIDSPTITPSPTEEKPLQTSDTTVPENPPAPAQGPSVKPSNESTSPPPPAPAGPGGMLTIDDKTIQEAQQLSQAMTGNQEAVSPVPPVISPVPDQTPLSSVPHFNETMAPTTPPQPPVNPPAGPTQMQPV